MALSLEERKRKLIEDVCASCSGGDGNGVGENVGGEEGLPDTPDKLAQTLTKIRKGKKKVKKEEGDGT